MKRILSSHWHPLRTVVLGSTQENNKRRLDSVISLYLKHFTFEIASVIVVKITVEKLNVLWRDAILYIICTCYKVRSFFKSLNFIYNLIVMHISIETLRNTHILRFLLIFSSLKIIGPKFRCHIIIWELQYFLVVEVWLMNAYPFINFEILIEIYYVQKTVRVNGNTKMKKTHQVSLHMELTLWHRCHYAISRFYQNIVKMEPSKVVLVNI